MMKRSLGVVFGLAAVLAISAAYANGTHQPDGAWGHGYMGHGWGSMILGPLMMIAFIAAAVAVVVLLVRWLGGGRAMGSAAAGKTALDILEERYARGEIDKDEFEERRRVLTE